MTATAGNFCFARTFTIQMKNVNEENYVETYHNHMANLLLIIAYRERWVVSNHTVFVVSYRRFLINVLQQYMPVRISLYRKCVVFLLVWNSTFFVEMKQSLTNYIIFNRIHNYITFVFVELFKVYHNGTVHFMLKFVMEYCCYIYLMKIYRNA